MCNGWAASPPRTFFHHKAKTHMYVFGVVTSCFFCLLGRFFWGREPPLYEQVFFGAHCVNEMPFRAGGISRPLAWNV